MPSRKHQPCRAQRKHRKRRRKSAQKRLPCPYSARNAEAAEHAGNTEGAGEICTKAAPLPTPILSRKHRRCRAQRKHRKRGGGTQAAFRDFRSVPKAIWGVRPACFFNSKPPGQPVTTKSKNLAQRFRVRKAGGFGPDESPFGVRLPPYGGTEGGRSDETSDEIWPKSDLFLSEMGAG